MFILALRGAMPEAQARVVERGAPSEPPTPKG